MHIVYIYVHMYIYIYVQLLCVFTSVQDQVQSAQYRESEKVLLLLQYPIVVTSASAAFYGKRASMARGLSQPWAITT